MNQGHWKRFVSENGRRLVIASASMLLAAACADAQETNQADDIVTNDSALTSTWTTCSTEWQRCSFSGTHRVRFGANGVYAPIASFSNGVDCNSKSFGTDPVPGVTKSCEVETEQAAPASGTWVQCSAEWQRCSFSGTHRVRYGANGKYATIASFTNGVDCNNTTFGTDPAPGVAKACEVEADQSSTPAPTPTPTPTPAPTSTPAPSPTTTLPPQLCTSALALADTSRPTTVVGTGTSASCTEQALRTAVANGGVITFNCGSSTTTIGITQTLVAPADKDTTIDGNDRIVLDGRGATQILRAYHDNFRANDRALTVQRIALIGGRDAGVDFRARDGQKTCAWGYKSGGGGAIYARDVNVRVWGVTFESNNGPELGPDVAGGALYVVGAKKLAVANSTFRNNSAANGGGIGVLHTSTELYNVVFESNRATGMLANFANDTGCPTFNHEEQGGAGGLGGAFYSDGFDPGDYFCGVRMSDNSSGDLGGAIFRSAYWGLLSNVGKQTITWERSTFERNRSAAGGGGAAYVNNSYFTLRGVTFTSNDCGQSDGGGLKLTGLTVNADDVQFSTNHANWGGGVAHWGGGPEGAGTATNIRFSQNAPNDSVGDFPLAK